MLDDFGGPLVNDYTDRSRNNDKALPVQFYLKPFENPKTGKWEEQEYVRIITDQKHIIDRPVRYDFAQSRPHKPDPERFYEQYQKFKQNEEQVSGIPITQVPGLSTIELTQIKSIGLRTVEQVAGVPDSELHRLGLEGRKLRDKMKSYLEVMNGEGHQLALKNRQLEKKSEQQEELIKTLQEQMKELHTLIKEKPTSAKKQVKKQLQEAIE